MACILRLLGFPNLKYEGSPCVARGRISKLTPLPLPWVCQTTPMRLSPSGEVARFVATIALWAADRSGKRCELLG